MLPHGVTLIKKDKTVMPYSLTFDPYGTNAANLITVIRTLSPPQSDSMRVLFPIHGPFFVNDNSIQLLTDSGLAPLTEGIDYTFIAPFSAAIQSTGKLVYGGILFNNPNFQGTVEHTLRYLGGDWVVDVHGIYEELIAKAYNPRTVTWEQLVNVQAVFPPTQHLHPAEETIDYNGFVTKLAELVASLSDPAIRTQFVRHFTETNNPHNVTIAQLGFENLEQRLQALESRLPNLGG